VREFRLTEFAIGYRSDVPPKVLTARSRRRSHAVALEPRCALTSEGGRQLTTSRIAREAGVAQPTFYVHFRDLDDLLSRAEVQLDGFRREFHKRGTGSTSPPLRRRLDRALREAFRLPLKTISRVRCNSACTSRSALTARRRSAVIAGRSARSSAATSSRIYRPSSALPAAAARSWSSRCLRRPDRTHRSFGARLPRRPLPNVERRGGPARRLRARRARLIAAVRFPPPSLGVCGFRRAYFFRGGVRRGPAPCSGVLPRIRDTHAIP
jgi:AcrR family transcriptional regulator